MHFGSATRPSQRTHSAFRDRRRDCIKALDALFSDQGTLHLALPPLPTLLIGLDCPKKRPEALRSRLRPWLRFGGIRAPKRGRLHPKTALETRSKGFTKVALEPTCSTAAKSDQNDHCWHVFELLLEIFFEIFYFCFHVWTGYLFIYSCSYRKNSPLFVLFSPSKYAGGSILGIFAKTLKK